ncbi:UDP-N-acetylmuramoyl-L-alanine--D-glutamate ligase [Patescibacteria group bacterium]|nr:UDP-N-acetylmuramoyl-L-alanine--D-glutamate ligase [Patescibacteria group bacterium]
MNIKSALVIGMGESGKEAALLLKKKGAKVVVGEIKNDDKMEKEAEKLRKKGIQVVLGPHFPNLLKDKEIVVVSPGVSLRIPLIQEAHQNGIPVIGELELASRYLSGQDIIAITGTNGKSTTVMLSAEILSRAGFEVKVAGNIGIPLSRVVRKPSPIIVMEVSSFQLETVEQFSPHIFSLLNITPDHLNRHCNFNRYVEVKSNLLKKLKAGDFAILNRDDEIIFPLAKKTKAKVIFFSERKKLKEGVFLEGDKIVACLKDKFVIPTDNISLTNFHSWENVLCSVAISAVYKIKEEVIRQALASFRSLAHRQEWAGEIEGIDFIDDSKATNVGAVLKCLDLVKKPGILIMGGRDKGGDFSKLKQMIKKKVKLILLLGEAKPKIKEQLLSVKNLVEVDSIEEAVRIGFKMAKKGDCVLLSPGCSSFDQFKSYKERGNVFKEEVKKFKEKVEKKCRI